MRTNIDIDDELLNEAREATGLKTKKAVVEEGLRRIIRARRQVEAIKALEGLGWEGGDYKEFRKDRKLPEW